MNKVIKYINKKINEGNLEEKKGFSVLLKN